MDSSDRARSSATCYLTLSRANAALGGVPREPPDDVKSVDVMRHNANAILLHALAPHASCHHAYKAELLEILRQGDEEPSEVY